MDLIYCAGGNEKLDQIAREEGFLLGVRSDNTSYFPLQFVDNRYHKCNFERHLDRVKEEVEIAGQKIKYVTVPDLSDKEFSLTDIDRAFAQVERIREYCEVPLIVPKLMEQLPYIPKSQVIAFSIPTDYGGVKFSFLEVEPKGYLTGYRVHLLGGSPQLQVEYYLTLTNMGNTVISADGSASKKGIRWGDYWSGFKWAENPNKERGHYLVN